MRRATLPAPRSFHGREGRNDRESKVMYLGIGGLIILIIILYILFR
jgi:hypothetical protein